MIVVTMQREFYVREDGTPKSAKFAFVGHLEINPKYIKAKHSYLTGTGAEIPIPITIVEIFFTTNKVQGEKNETGTKRVLALLKWLENKEVKEHDYFHFSHSNISEEDFVKAL